MGSSSRSGRLAALSIAAVVALSLAYGDGAVSAMSSGITLPRKVVVARSVVNRLFPEVTRQTSTGRNPTATSNPKATRIVIYANGDGSKKVTITGGPVRQSR